MDESAWGFIGVIAGAIVGAAASILTTVLASNNAVRLQQNADSQERKERARAFQRETLIAVQDTFNEVLRLMMKIYRIDSDAYEKGVAWRKSIIDKNIDEEYQTLNRNLLILNERIADDVLREELNMLHRNILNAYRATSKEETDALVDSVSNQSDPFLKHLGTVLRNLY